MKLPGLVVYAFSHLGENHQIVGPEVHRIVGTVEIEAAGFIELPLGIFAAVSLERLVWLDDFDHGKFLAFLWSPE